MYEHVPFLTVFEFFSADSQGVQVIRLLSAILATRSKEKILHEFPVSWIKHAVLLSMQTCVCTSYYQGHIKRRGYVTIQYYE